MGDNELGTFLRSRRVSLSPAELGLPEGGRRRTPGLRRAEVAALSGVSVEYVTRLEQGRDRRPSPPVLAALAETLRLTPAERVHLYRLTKGADPGFTCRGDEPPGRVVRPTVRRLLDRLEPTAAVLLNRLTELVAYTPGFAVLAGPTGLLDGTHPNLARYVFTDPRARTAFPDWAWVADGVVATLKQGPFRADRHIAALVDELGAEFAGRESQVPGLPVGSGEIRIAGRRLAFETLDLPVDDDQRLVVLLDA